jgi:Na+/proline symporter
MSVIDWGIVLAFLLWMLRDGVRARAQAGTPEGYLLAGRQANFWVMGLSIMATQASAVTLLSTTGVGFVDGLAFGQFYLFLPLAMLILAFTAVPYFRKRHVYTAYEALEARFGRRVRTLTASTFLILRTISLGGILAAPALAFHGMTGYPYEAIVFITALVAVVYTRMGGLAVVFSTDVKQMGVMLLGLTALFFLVVLKLPEGLGWSGSLAVAEATGKLRMINTEFDPRERYTLWSALFGGTVVFLAYFGTDQSQVQRYLAGKSLGHQRGALYLNALAKVPFQYGILLLGVLMSIQVLADPLPLDLTHRMSSTAEQREVIDHWNSIYLREQNEVLAIAQRYASERSQEDRASLLQSIVSQTATRQAGERALAEAGLSVKPVKNLLMPYYLRHRVPVGMLGILLIAILAAALSSMDSELNSLSAVATLDILRKDPNDPDAAASVVACSRNFTILFGTIAALFALQFARMESLVEGINDLGSLFYGALLGVFLLLWFDRRAHGRGVLLGLVTGVAGVVLLRFAYDLFKNETAGPFPWLYQSTLGVTISVLVGALASRAMKDVPGRDSTTGTLPDGPVR